MRALLLGAIAAALAAGACNSRGQVQSSPALAEERVEAPQVAGAEEQLTPAPTSEERAAEPKRAEILERLTAPSPIEELPIEGHLPAIVALPLGAIGPRPVVVFAHGNNDGPQWACPSWRGVVGHEAFILCPRGVPRPGQPAHRDPGQTRYTYPSYQALDAEIDAGLAALRARYGAHVDDGPVLYTGFSLGSNLGVAVSTGDPERYRRVVLIEGGHDRWTPQAVEAFARGGGERVLFLCGQWDCVHAAKPKVKMLEEAGVKAKMIHAAGMGHVYHGAIAEQARAALPWLLEGDARWERLAPVR